MGKFWPSLSRAFSNAPNLVQKKTHILFYRSSPTLFPKCPDNSAKTAAGAAPPLRRPQGKQGRPRAREGRGRYFTWSIHLFSPIARWVGIGCWSGGQAVSTENNPRLSSSCHSPPSVFAIHAMEVNWEVCGRGRWLNMGQK